MLSVSMDGEPIMSSGRKSDDYRFQDIHFDREAHRRALGPARPHFDGNRSVGFHWSRRPFTDREVATGEAIAYLLWVVLIASIISLLFWAI